MWIMELANQVARPAAVVARGSMPLAVVPLLLQEKSRVRKSLVGSEDQARQVQVPQLLQPYEPQ